MSYSIDGTDVQTDNIHLDVVRGFNEPADVEGEDDTVPEAEGMEPGVWTKRSRTIHVEGKVEGTGATQAEKQASWRTASDTLRDLMDRTAVREHVLGPPDHGVSGDWSINARCVSAIGGPILNAWTLQKWSFELVSIDSPPEWVEAESS